MDDIFSKLKKVITNATHKLQDKVVDKYRSNLHNVTQQWKAEIRRKLSVPQPKNPNRIFRFRFPYLVKGFLRQSFGYRITRSTTKKGRRVTFTIAPWWKDTPDPGRAKVPYAKYTDESGGYDTNGWRQKAKNILIDKLEGARRR